MHKAPTADRRRRPTRGAAEAPTQGWRLAETPRLRPAAA